MSNRLTCTGAVVLAMLTMTLTAETATLDTKDGLRLEVSDRGTVTGVSIGGKPLEMTGPGGFFVADFKVQPAPVNLVPNPGFEDGAEGWQLAKGQALDGKIARGGKASVRLVVAGPEPDSSSFEVQVPVKPDTRYRAGMWLRRQSVGVCGAYISELDDQGRSSGQQLQVGASIPKKDGEWLPLKWEFTTQAKTSRLSVRANIYRSTGRLWVDDFFVEEVGDTIYEPVEGETRAAADGIGFAGAIPARGLEIGATLRGGPDCVKIDGEIRDTTGHDRAVAVKFALPLDLAGWTWHHDAEERETIEENSVLDRTYACQTGVGVCSVYPWSAATGPEGGLSLGLPLAQGPRVFLLRHDQKRRETSLTFYFGLAKDAGRNPSRAPFSLVLYTHDPRSGMRSAMQTYYRLFAESFVKRPTFEGYLNYANLETFDADNHRLVVNSHDAIEDPGDFGEGYKLLYALHGCYDFWLIPSEEKNLPSDESVLGILRGMDTGRSSRSFPPAAETLEKVVFGADGKISYIGDTAYWRPHEGYNHTDKGSWGLNFRVNEDPDISPVLADRSRAIAKEHASTPGRRDWDGTFTADAIDGYFANARCPDSRRSHFRTTHAPLSFGKDNLEPCMPNTIWDFHKKAWWPISQEHKIVIYGNSNTYEQLFTAPFIDLPMSEGSWDAAHPARLDRYMRAINHRKLVRHWRAWDDAGNYGERNAANVRRQFHRGLAYAIYPPVYGVAVANGDIEQFRPLYRQYVPAIEELSVAGWDPLPHATASGGVVVERFGTFAHGELHYTVRNYATQPVRAVLLPDREGLGVAADAELFAIDVVQRNPELAPVPHDGLPLDVEAEGTRAVWVGTRDQAAQHGFRLALATLEKIDRVFSRDIATVSATLSQAVARARAGTEAAGDRALVLAEELRQLAVTLGADLKTPGPVDLAKLLYRLRSEVSLVPVATLNIRTAAPRLVADALPGEPTTVGWRFDPGRADASTFDFRIESPWGEVAQESGVTGKAPTRTARLSVPAAPQRRLLPFLLEARGKANGRPVTVATLVDVQVGMPLTVTLAPEKLERGTTSPIEIAVANRSARKGRCTVSFELPAHVTIEPAIVTLDVPAGETAKQPLSLTLERNVPIGDLKLAYAIKGDDPALNQAGRTFVTVEGK